VFDSGKAVKITWRGNSYSDSTSKKWDAVAAASEGSGYQVLREGEAVYKGKYSIWDIDSSGKIIGGSGWKTAAQATALGWETEFNSDLNGDNVLTEVKGQYLF